jgi:hypothetical protein
MNLTYTLNVPFATNNPSFDQPNMETNNDNNALLWMIDHHGFNDNLGGYHNLVHFTTQLTQPAKTPIAGQVYTLIPTAPPGQTDAQLFYQSPAGIITQLTNSTGVIPSPGQNGYTTLPGGFILQWGFTTLFKSSIPTPVLFATNNINFPTNCFNITIGCITGEGNSPGENNYFIKEGSVSNTGFTIVNSSGSSARSLYWQAIGN